MASVNLIPREILLEHRKVRRIRVWLVIGGAAWILASIPVVRELSAEYQLSSHRAAAVTIAEQVDHARHRRKQSAQRLKLLREEVARAEKLRYKRRWTAMISVIALSAPQDVWLTEFATDPSRPAVVSGSTPPLPQRRLKDSLLQPATQAGYETLIGKAGPRRLLLEGRALGLEEIYSFVDAINALEVFKDASIREVRGDVVEGLKVTRFTLECEW